MAFQMVKTAVPVLDPSKLHCLFQQLHPRGLENLPPINTSKLGEKDQKGKSGNVNWSYKTFLFGIRQKYNHPQIAEKANGHTTGSLFFWHHLMQNQSSLQSQEKRNNVNG